MEEETWLPVEGFPDYEVSHYGRVRNAHTGRILGIFDNGRGTLQVNLRRDKTNVVRAVHRLVAEAFLHTAPDGAVPIFLDGDRTNLRADNLEWRPLWFARARTQQMRRGTPRNNRPVKHQRTGRVFANAWEAAMEFDDLEDHILLSARNGGSFSARSGSYEFHWD